ncbi:hypothetical protein, partial [Sulfitobacter sp. 1A12056]|uniref:hypothetical protein n=1 Tax=Sulfitobacter sp. 1A12056 TaxID=3368592 RepID=UPI003745FAB5
MTLTIQFNSGWIPILSDLHANTYDHRGTDPITSLGGSVPGSGVGAGVHLLLHSWCCSFTER